MRTAPVARVVAAGLTRRRPAIVIGLVLAISATASLPAAAGCLGGVILGNLLARPLLASAAYVFGPGVLGVPAWVDVDVAVVMFGLTALAALAPARRLTRVP
jgi:putative ABC transport system permease protein